MVRNCRSPSWGVTRIVSSVAFVCLTGFSHSVACSEDVVARSELVSKIEFAYSRITRGLHVRYSVNQQLVAAGADSTVVHIGGRPPGKKMPSFWRAEHAHVDGGGKMYHLTTGSRYVSAEADALLSKNVHNGEIGYARTRDNGLARVLRGTSLKTDARFRVAQEELYKEILGFESSSQDVFRTFRGFKSPEPYDLLTVARDEAYVIKNAGSAYGENVVVLEKPNADSIWLDASRNYAIVRRERRWGAGKPVQAVFTNSDFKRVDGVWLPRKSVIEYFGYPDTSESGRVVVRAVLTVQHLSLSPPESLFEPNLKGIVQVVDVERGNSHVRLRPFDGKTLSEFLDAAPLDVEIEPHTGRGTSRTVFVLLNVVVVGAVFLFLYIRRKHIRRQRPT